MKHSRELWRTVVHEAGHAIADHVMGFGPYLVRVTEENLGSGKTLSRDAWPSDENRKAYAVSSLCGRAAEYVLGAADETTEAGAFKDLLQARAALEGTLVDFTDCEKEAVAFVEANGAAIKNLANSLLVNNSLYGFELTDQIHDALGIARYPRDPNASMGEIEAIAQQRLFPALVSIPWDWEEGTELIVRPLSISDRYRLNLLVGHDELLVHAHETNNHRTMSVREVVQIEEWHYRLVPFYLDL